MVSSIKFADEKLDVVAVVGSRDYDNTQHPTIEEVVAELASSAPHVTVISGGARGVDRRAVAAARENGLTVREYPANWARYGKHAGYLRNEEIVKAADMVIAFWDGESPGTKHTIGLCMKHHRTLLLYQNGVLQVIP
jgi:hypothetical protein